MNIANDEIWKNLEFGGCFCNVKTLKTAKLRIFGFLQFENFKNCKTKNFRFPKCENYKNCITLSRISKFRNKIRIHFFRCPINFCRLNFHLFSYICVDFSQIWGLVNNIKIYSSWDLYCTFVMKYLVYVQSNEIPSCPIILGVIISKFGENSKRMRSLFDAACCHHSKVFSHAKVTR